MPPEVGLALASIGLILTSAFFVAAEYAMVGARRSAIESSAKRGHRGAARLLKALDELPAYVAGIQIAITMLGIGLGLVAEPFLSSLITRGVEAATGGPLVGWIATTVRVFSLVMVTYLSVVFGELVPKYLSLRSADKIALLTVGPLTVFVRVLKPLVWLVQSSGSLVLKAFGIDASKDAGEVVSRDELSMLVRSGGLSGVLEKSHAEMVSRALKLDGLTAQDIMIHRLDVKWIDVSCSRDELISKLKAIPNTRIPVCRGDIDDMVGILYLHDAVKAFDRPTFDLEKIVRPVIAVPESLSVDRIIDTMREQKSQILIVMDEYGGTSGLITLEDVIEEVFGELEDSVESERPTVVTLPGGRISARAELRFDELVDRLGLDYPDASTDTLAEILITELDRVPRPGDAVETPIGLMRVENMARRRITRVSINLKPEYAAAPQIS